MFAEGFAVRGMRYSGICRAGGGAVSSAAKTLSLLAIHGSILRDDLCVADGTRITACLLTSGRSVSCCSSYCAVNNHSIVIVRVRLGQRMSSIRSLHKLSLVGLCVIDVPFCLRDSS